MQVIERRFLSNDAELKKMVDEEFQKLQIGQTIYNLRKEVDIRIVDCDKQSA